MARIFQITTTIPNAHILLEQISSDSQIDFYQITIKYPEVQIPAPVRIDWDEDMVNILHVWHPLSGDHHAMHQWFAATKCRSRFVEGAPVLCTIGADGINSETVAVSDAETPITISYAVKDLDQQDKVGYSVEFFSQQCDPLQTYTAKIRIDRRQIPYYEAVMCVSDWWAEHGLVIPPSPESAESPLYSSWYNFHQAPDGKKLLADLKIAANLGFRTVILDDGWQFEGPSLGDYSKCGEWTVATGKFENFKKFTNEVHALGMKLMVWFAVPFIGINSPMYEKFVKKQLSYSEFNKCATLDPRYPDVRKYLLDTYRDFLLQYDIDGFKLDFVDSFQPGDLTSEYSSDMDCSTVDEAVKKLLTEITEQLAQVKPDLLYEYRQNYVGPGINHFGNMLRVADCAYDAQANRIGIVNLRLMDYPIAIHSDMLFWSKKESIRLCAKQLLNILFAVPQISVILAGSTATQRSLLKHYIEYWTTNRDLILHGKFRALHPELNYTFVSAEHDQKIIAVLYTDQTYTYTGKSCDVFHNGNQDGLVFENPTDKMLNAEIFNCLGILLEQTSVPPQTICRLSVPVTGMLRIK